MLELGSFFAVKKQEKVTGLLQTHFFAADIFLCAKAEETNGKKSDTYFFLTRPTKFVAIY